MMSGNNSVVECNLAKVEVASSNLVSRSIGNRPVFRPRNSVVEYLLGKEEVIGSIPIVGSNVNSLPLPPIPRTLKKSGAFSAILVHSVQTIASISQHAATS